MEFLENLKPVDLVMADRGLTIEESLALKLNWQSLFLIKKKSQLDPISVEKSG